MTLPMVRQGVERSAVARQWTPTTGLVPAIRLSSMATTIAPVASGVLNLAAPPAKAVTDNGKLTRYARGVVTVGEKRSRRDRVGASGELDNQFRQYEAVL